MPAAATPLSNPVNFVDPSLLVTQQQIDRQRQLAQALREQSLKDDDVVPGSRISWTQGAARLADALVARDMLKKTDQQQTALGAQYANALRTMFGANPPRPSAAPAPAPDMSSSPQASDPSGPAAAPAPTVQLPATGQSISLPPPEQASAPADAAAAPPPAPAAAPAAPAASAQPAPSAAGPLNLTGDANQDMALYSLDPDDYMKAAIGAHAPTDAVKNLMAAGLMPGTPEFNQALGAINKKAGFIDPTNLRGGSSAMLNDGSGRIIYNPTIPEGFEPVRDAQGNVTSIRPIEGGPAAVEATAAAKARGGAAGELVQVWDPNKQQMVQVPKSSVLAGGANAGAPAGPPLGADQFAGTMGKAGGAYFSGLADSAADAPNRIYALKQMLPLINGKTEFGPGTPMAEKFAGFVNGIGKAIGLQPNFNAANVANVNEFNKWASQYSARAAADLGLQGSDKRIDMTVAATPNGHMTNDALRRIIPQMIGLENAKQGMANAGQAFAQAHPGPNAQAQFLTAWRGAYDPRIFTAMAQGPAAVQQLLKSAPAADRAALIHKSQVLASMGAFQQ